jgi:hypothetical protein
MDDRREIRARALRLRWESIRRTAYRREKEGQCWYQERKQIEEGDMSHPLVRKCAKVDSLLQTVQLLEKAICGVHASQANEMQGESSSPALNLHC